MKNSLSKMACLDLYLSKLSKEEYDAINLEEEDYKEKIMPLISWDVFEESKLKRLEAIERKTDIDIIKSFAKEHKWKNDLDLIFSKHDFDAIVITNRYQKIQWVNNGFTKMTGYSKKYAINKHPSFLQGKLTSDKTKESIRKHINANKPFKEVIINYKKDKTPYKCEISVFPLYNNKTTHFVALEREVV
ncbi:PAS domain-containing protein [Pseudotenacibaculum haliotis]|uniref:PAS domain-containing protein n=1 Tax=Pseudotenacibaculum haliotis TaxID=1862138 RepID=A0ABW5LTD3_9FLAO